MWLINYNLGKVNLKTMLVGQRLSPRKAVPGGWRLLGCHGYLQGIAPSSQTHLVDEFKGLKLFN